MFGDVRVGGVLDGGVEVEFARGENLVFNFHEKNDNIFIFRQ